MGRKMRRWYNCKFNDIIKRKIAFYLLFVSRFIYKQRRKAVRWKKWEKGNHRLERRKILEELMKGSDKGKFDAVFREKKGERSGWYVKLGSEVIAFNGVYSRWVAFFSQSSVSSSRKSLFRSVFRALLWSGAKLVIERERERERERLIIII